MRREAVSLRARATLAAAAVVAGCAAPTPTPEGPRLTAEQGRARVAKLLPRNVADRGGWAADIYAAFAALQVDPSVENVCAVIAVTEQESTFRVDPAVPNLAAIAWKEIERQREKLGIPSLVLKAALALPSSDGRSYSERIDAATTERELSETFDDFAKRVPLGERFLAERNPVRTGGPMQVSIAYATAHARQKPYPYPMRSIRDEVFTRRGGMYFGIAHLLDYPAAYDSPLYRFADYNAGHYASRNAAFQKAVANLTGVALALDGDLVAPGGKADTPGATEAAVRVLGERLGLSNDAIRRDLEKESSPDFERTRLYARVFEMADRQAAALPGKASAPSAPRAVVPQIRLQSPKITRALTTEWFARRVADRHRNCLVRGRTPD